MRTGTVLLVGAALLLTAALPGCNGETATPTPTSTPVGTPTPAPTDGATPAPTPTQLESGTVAVYYQASLGGGTSYHTVEGQTLVMKGSGGGVFRYLTEQDDVTMVEDYVSPRVPTGLSVAS